VNLDEVAKMMQNGDDVRVVNAMSGEDITRLILMQIIVEDAKTPDSNFPLDVLRQMVIASGKASQESALKYINAVMDISQNAYQAMAPPFSPFEFIPQKDTPSGGPVSHPGPNASEATPHQAKNPESGEVDELKRRLAELETLVSGLAPKKSARKKK
jgi:polyhydroxyalkanoate synthesis repressor PhaR